MALVKAAYVKRTLGEIAQAESKLVDGKIASRSCTAGSYTICPRLNIGHRHLNSIAEAKQRLKTALDASKPASSLHTAHQQSGWIDGERNQGRLAALERHHEFWSVLKHCQATHSTILFWCEITRCRQVGVYSENFEANRTGMLTPNRVRFVQGQPAIVTQQMINNGPVAPSGFC